MREAQELKDKTEQFSAYPLEVICIFLKLKTYCMICKEFEAAYEFLITWVSPSAQQLQTTRF